MSYSVPQVEVKGCRIKDVPLELVIPAAARAIELNPRNTPPEDVLREASRGQEPLPQARLALLTSKRWNPCGVRLTVGFVDGPSEALRKRILAHMNAWSAFSNVEFVATSGTAQVRIDRAAGDGYWSYLGTDVLTIPANQPTMNLDSFTMETPDSEFFRVVRHETGHTLGFPHEHMRAEIIDRIDREKAITYFMATQHWTREEVIAQVLTPIPSSALIATAHADPASIMCYMLPGTIMKDGIGVPGGADIDGQDSQFATSVYSPEPYAPVFAQADPGNGIGGYDLKSPADRAFAFDYDSSGKPDHVVLYRPGKGAIFILKRSGAQFTAVFAQADPGGGIGGYDLKSPADQAFAFDYDSSGKLDHLVLFRPGAGAVFILKRNGTQFVPVFAQADPGGGIGGYDLKSPADRAFAFDYNGTGKQDHLVFYRPGKGAVFILKRVGAQFTPVFAQGDPGGGIGGYDLKSPADRGFAFDYDGTGKQDHLVFYRPGKGAVFILKRVGTQFTAVFAQADPGNGIGGYDLKSAADLAFAIDFDGSGKIDHLVFYRPGTGAIFILRRSGTQFVRVAGHGDPGCGIGGYDLRSPADQAFAYQDDVSGRMDQMVLYRPGKGAIFILRKKA